MTKATFLSTHGGVLIVAPTIPRWSNSIFIGTNYLQGYYYLDGADGLWYCCKASFFLLTGGRRFKEKRPFDPNRQFCLPFQCEMAMILFFVNHVSCSPAAHEYGIVPGDWLQCHIWAVFLHPCCWWKIIPAMTVFNVCIYWTLDMQRREVCACLILSLQNHLKEANSKYNTLLFSTKKRFIQASRKKKRGSPEPVLHRASRERMRTLPKRLFE